MVGEYVDVYSKVTHTAVKGSDNYYHLDSADGDVLLVDMDYMYVLTEVLKSERPVMYVYSYDENGKQIKYNISDAIQAYEKVCDSNMYYPLTEDLMYFYQDYAEKQGLYSYVLGSGYNEDSAWMFACLTMKLPVHEHDYKAAVTAPTCTSDGFTRYSCSCGDSYVADRVKATGHVYADGACTECGEADPNAEHSHKYQDVVTPPTCTADGFTTCSCSCGDSFVIDTVKALGHNYVEGTCSTCGEADPDYVVIHAPVVTITNDAATGSIKLSWKKVEGAAKYAIYRASSATGTPKKITTTSKTTYTNSSITVGNTYYYYVVALSGDGRESEPSTTVSATRKLARPVITASNDAKTGRIVISWKAVEGAKKYQVWRSTSKNGKYTLRTTITGTRYTNSGLAAGKTYYYKVVAVASNSEANSAESLPKIRTADLAQPVIKVSNRASDGAVKISWEKIEGATKYQVYRSTSKNGTYTRIGTTTKTSYNSTSGTVGKTYYYKVWAICANEDATSAFSAIKYRARDLARPDVEITKKSGKPYLDWDKVSGATKYEVYRATSKNGTYKRVTTTTNRYYKDTKAVKGKIYYYKVIAVCKNTSGNSAYSSVVSAKATK